MKRAALFSLSVVFSIAAEAGAQSRSYAPLRRSTERPTLSPYLGLVNNNNDMAYNYYEIYRPQVRSLQADRRLSADLRRLRTEVEKPPATPRPEISYPLGPTGHPTTFMSYGRYFPGAKR